MEKIYLPEKAKYLFDFIEGADINEKFRNLVRGDLERRLGICSERICNYEMNYGMNFVQFETAWKKDTIKDKHSHGVEQDFME